MHKGEVWLVNLDPTTGAEIHKTRPAVIVSEDAIGILPLRVIVPLTDWKERYSIAPWLVKIDAAPGNGLAKSSAADAFQIRSVSALRLTQRLGALSTTDLELVIEAVAVVVGINR